MTDENLMQLMEDFPDMVQENLDQGVPATYRDEVNYPGLLLKVYPNGRLESIDVDDETFETIVLKVLKEGHE